MKTTGGSGILNTVYHNVSYLLLFGRRELRSLEILLEQFQLLSTLFFISGSSSSYSKKEDKLMAYSISSAPGLKLILSWIFSIPPGSFSFLQ